MGKIRQDNTCNRRIFKTGFFLASCEKITDVSTFHIDVSDEEVKCEVPKVIDSNFEATKFAFHEHCSFKSNLNGNVFKEKCYVILGFNLPEEDSYNFSSLTGKS